MFLRVNCLVCLLAESVISIVALSLRLRYELPGEGPASHGMLDIFNPYEGETKMSWNEPDREDTTIYKVVMNHEEQYSIWPDYKDIPPGWKHAGKTGPKPECLSYIKQVWTDMRPLSLRQRMEELANNPVPPATRSDPGEPSEKSLVDKLCEMDHPVEVSVKPSGDLKLFKEAIDRQYIHIRFPQTKGGTDLGFRLDQNASDFSAADFENRKGNAHVEGGLTLDYIKVRCVADIDLGTLKGSGRLVKIDTRELSIA